MSYEKGCVLAALSLSDELESIAERARQLAQSLNLSLLFVHVVDDTALFDYANSFSLSGLISGQYDEDESNKELMARQMIEKRLALLGESEKLEIRAGACAETIETLARQRQSSIIVLGQPEKHFGSIIMHIARYAPCDVHIVRTIEK